MGETGGRQDLQDAADLLTSGMASRMGSWSWVSPSAAHPCPQDHSMTRMGFSLRPTGSNIPHEASGEQRLNKEQFPTEGTATPKYPYRL